MIDNVADDEGALNNFCATARRDLDAPLILVVAAHPDDETIGMGAQILRLRNTYILHITDGSPINDFYTRAAGFKTRQHYAEARKKESLRALGTAGIPPSHIRCLGIVDQESPYQLEAMATSIAAAIEELNPDIIITHPYEGGHPDHDATAFGVHAALQLVPPDQVRPALLEFTSYHLKEGCLQTCNFLGSNSFTRTVYLSAVQQALKSKMLSCYVTQQAVLAAFPVLIERFRVAPHYDFSEAPHEGPLYYDNRAWGITSEQWRTLAVKSMTRLGIAGSF